MDVRCACALRQDQNRVSEAQVEQDNVNVASTGMRGIIGDPLLGTTDLLLSRDARWNSKYGSDLSTLLMHVTNSYCSSSSANRINAYG